MTRAFVVGHPIAHSRSPLIHGHWLLSHGLEGSYERLDVAPADFPEFVRTFAERGYAGGNVTIPHKEAAYRAVDRRTERAEKLKAVNTLWVEDGLVWGDNTDVLGFMAHLDETLGQGWERAVDTALVIGAGGAARAVAAGLQERPIGRILVANRTFSKAQDLMRDLAGPGAALEALPWERLGEAVEAAGLVVNTTSLGMTGQPPLDIDLAGARPGAAVADIVYVPLRTPLLAAAEARGLRTVDGLGMLLHQAAPGFRRWFGIMPQVTPELRALVAADLGERT
ncbi:shikimate dehydrogenase [Microvirga thermotolerans]|uniref:Shikimate dehydrogenase (NADP(+)) n=1 Tax=Microvirga thermotolerans TaxID=2651334 RepID=A0A5P9JQC1_9HYPH|nr:shikimate dehydrogenase [Microvirga thermotolerans]QFU14962.1 shikimate dehydrogenase [Microvirga thermotolerans]